MPVYPTIGLTYKHAQLYSEQIWKRWVKEYLPSLISRAKWNQNTDIKIKEGDLVWLLDSGQPRSSYILGRILELLPGDDGRVRTVGLKTKFGTYVRPIVKLVPLGTDDGVPEKPGTGPAMSGTG